MKNEKILTGLVVAMSLASPMAGAQTNYPPNFEPQVLYRDADLIAKHANRPAAAPAPKAVAPAVAAPSSTSAAPAPSYASTPSSSSASTGDSGGSSNLPIILAGLAFAGAAFWFTRRPSAATGQSSGGFVPAVAAAGGVTGVAQYVEGLTSGGVETSVSKYIKGLPPIVVPQTGVGKYLRNLPPPEVAAPVETGVTKYLKSLPKPPVLPTDETGVTKYLKSL